MRVPTSHLITPETGFAARIVAPLAFHFAEPFASCPYWGNGEHIVAGGDRRCRCGKRFVLVEDMTEVSE